MANVPMKDIQFPGLDDTYTFAQIDNTLTQTGQAADAKKTGDEITALKNDLTAVETDIETGNLTAGTAKQLLSDTGMTDKSPYLFRAMPTGAGDREEPVIVGGSVVWNQLVTTVRSTATFNGLTFTKVDDATIKIEGTATADEQTNITNVIPRIVNHVYLITLGTSSNNNYWLASKSVKSGDGILDKFGTDGNITVTLAYANGASINIEVKPCIHDLTAMFGTAVADYAYALEQATAGAGIAWLKKYGFFTQDYYPYTEPTFKHVEGLASHKMVGFNAFDKSGTVNVGFLYNDNTTGSANTFRYTDYIHVVPGMNYYFKGTGGANPAICWYDADKGYITGSANNEQTNRLLQAPVNAHYVRASFPTANLDTFCINLSDPAKNGTYEPYKSYTYPLDPDVVLRGIPKLDASNNLYFDGDVYKPDGTVSRRYGIVDLGTLPWQYDSTNARFCVNGLNAKRVVTGRSPFICEKYIYSATSTDSGVGFITPSTSSYELFIYDSVYTDATAFKAAVSGTYMVYEKATPITETADPFAPLQLADPFGTEEWVLDDEAFPMPVGQETFYPENLRAKIEGLPWNFANLIAPTEVSNVATRNYTAGNLLIVDNVLYKVTVNIANGGTITPGTNVTATTLAEVISALQ